MRLKWLRFEFGMEWAADEVWMAGDFYDLNVCAVGRRAGNLQPACRHRLFVLTVELVAMAVALADLGLAVDFLRQRSRLKLAWPCAEAHCASEFFYTA